MDPQVKAKLTEINQDFYERFAHSFSATRHQVQPGVRQVIQNMKPGAAILDIGCGNGTLARELAGRRFAGRYLGVDMSAGLLEKARQLLTEPPSGVYEFELADLSSPGWQNDIPQAPYDWLVSFAVLHHLPGEVLRQDTANAFRQLIAPDGYVAVSVWQWQNSPRLVKRVLPWSTVGLNPEDLDQGDVLLDWRAGESPGLRYVHTFRKDSLTALATQAGFTVIHSFLADGKSRDLALYQVWQAA
ncbi:MAG: methyltransferase domain-containing protein [Brevefilum sp.]|nr:methyltransferase domain-containing protein [Brevefilum sp.]